MLMLQCGCAASSRICSACYVWVEAGAHLHCLLRGGGTHIVKVAVVLEVGFDVGPACDVVPQRL